MVTYTAMSSLVPATVLWAMVMILPLILWYIDSSFFRIFVYLLYPILIGLMSRQGVFWVDMSVIMAASIVTFLLGFLLNLNKGNSNAMKKPRENKVRSALIFTSLSVVYISIIFAAGKLRHIYNPKNFT
jgi:hypothetical protein